MTNEKYFREFFEIEIKAIGYREGEKIFFFFFILFRHFALFTIKSGIERNKKKKNTKRLESKIEAVN